MKQVYVYYRIDPGQAHHAAEQIEALLARMGAYCKQPPQRLIGCADPTQWMEAYREIADYPAFAAALTTAADNLGCSAFTLGERHLECFLLPDPDSPGTVQP